MYKNKRIPYRNRKIKSVPAVTEYDLAVEDSIREDLPLQNVFDVNSSQSDIQPENIQETVKEDVQAPEASEQQLNQPVDIDFEEGFCQVCEQPSGELDFEDDICHTCEQQAVEIDLQDDVVQPVEQQTMEIDFQDDISQPIEQQAVEIEPKEEISQPIEQQTEKIESKDELGHNYKEYLAGLDKQIDLFNALRCGKKVKKKIKVNKAVWKEFNQIAKQFKPTTRNELLTMLLTKFNQQFKNDDI